LSLQDGLKKAMRVDPGQGVLLTGVVYHRSPARFGQKDANGDPGLPLHLYLVRSQDLKGIVVVGEHNLLDLRLGYRRVHGQ
jgi:hypothetical protein